MNHQQVILLIPVKKNIHANKEIKCNKLATTMTGYGIKSDTQSGEGEKVADQSAESLTIME
jgi:hypothetical protein